MSVFAELKRRRVFRIGIAYVVMAWLVLQVADVVLNNIGAPAWVFRVILLVLALGFPFSLAFAWAYELTPEGLRRERPVAPAPESETGSSEGAEDPTADEAPGPSAVPEASVAVLPFVNMSGNPENEYFSDGLSEELLNMLAKVDALKVAARTSSFHFKGRTGDVADIARQLGVSTVLEGSVRQSGARVRITTQLISAKEGYHLWSETFDRELDDIFAVQDEIAAAVVDALKVKLLGAEGERMDAGGTDDPEAFKAYLKGKHYRNKGSDERALHKAVAAYRHAIRRDPGYARAWAGLASALESLATNNFADLDEVVDQADDAASRAIELAPDLAAGYQVRATIALAYKLDKAAALDAINKAMTLDPGNVRVLIQHGQVCFSLGDLDGSLVSLRKAQALDPVSTIANHSLGYALYFARRYEEAIPSFRHALELDPHYPRPHYGIAMCRYLLGDVRSAATEVAMEPLDWMRFSGLAILEHRLGNAAEAEAAMASLIEGYRDNGLYQQAQVHAQWGDPNAAIEALERAREIGDPGVSQILVDPLLDPLREEPRFAKLMGDVGFR